MKDIVYLILLRLVFWISFVILPGCNGVFFHPDSITYFTPNPELTPFDKITIEGSAGKPLYGWLFYPAREDKGALIIHFHGNAQNRSAHISSTLWLTQYGFHVLSFDYSGYGESPGAPSVSALVEDGIAVLEFVQNHSKTTALKKILLGQSLGGAIGFVSSQRSEVPLDMVVLDSTFASYQGVAQEILRSHWLTWPFQWLPYLLIKDELAPINYLNNFSSQREWLVIHSQDDPIVPEAAVQPLLNRLPRDRRAFWSLAEAGHIKAFIPQSATGQRFISYTCQQLRLRNCSLH